MSLECFFEFEMLLADIEGLGCSIYEADDKQSIKIWWAQRLWLDSFRQDSVVNSYHFREQEIFGDETCENGPRIWQRIQRPIDT